MVGLVVELNGQYGLLAGTGERVEGCTASSNTLAGISTDTGGLVQSCAAHVNAGTGIALGTRSQALESQSEGNRAASPPEAFQRPCLAC